MLVRKMRGRTRSSRAALVTAAMTAAVAAVATACGSGGATSAVEATAQSCSTGVTDDEITVGILFPDTGLLSPQFTGYRFGIEARLAAANAEGGVDGRKITTVWRDDRFTELGNLEATQDLLREDVFAILEYTAFSERSATLLHDEGVPVLGVADSGTWAANDNMFPLAYQLDDNDATTTLGAFIRAQGGTTAAIVSTPITASARLYAEGARKSLSAAGIRIVYQDANAEAYSPESVERIIRSGADSLVSLVPADFYTAILAEASRVGRPYTVAISPLTYDANLLNTETARALAGTYSPVGFQVIERNQAAQQAYLTAMTTYAPQMQPATQLSSIYGYIAADMFLRGLQTQDGCPTRAGFIQGLRGVTDYDGAGLLNQKIDFSAAERLVDVCTDFIRVAPDGDAFEPVGAGPLCGEPVRGAASTGAG
ncbi:amino acid/amide ABC transporter substrate-binding protein, HAAT family [Frankia sp. EI5c]|uniref:ABC transporter substrate-binding protein n=1 Tax=Frankia sp. EI5c TaxID=683316 RepID=UPI0007C262D1|nr:ABC transporter substrate-binding protein [Frankia sp. EI5c]OAA28138.1 amino acid/amide ABC transporter substrate-binding protein, HAAT family [Frankia sp. EI5c]